MADFNPVEDIPLDNFDNDQNADDFSGRDDFADTTNNEQSSNLPDVDTGTEISSAENRQAMNDFYESLKKEGWDINENAQLEYKTSFKKDPKTKQISVKYGRRKIPLTGAKNPDKFLALSSIQNNYGEGGVKFIRSVLGVKDYSPGAKSKNTT